MRNIASLESNPNVPAGHVHVLLTYLTSGRRLESDPNVETLLEMYPPTQTLNVTLPDVPLSQLHQFLQIDFARVVGVDDFKVSYRPEKISEEIYSWLYSLSTSEERLNSVLISNLNLIGDFYGFICTGNPNPIDSNHKFCLNLI